MGKEIIKKYSNGDKEILFRFNVNSAKDAENAKFLIDQKLKSI